MSPWVFAGAILATAAIGAGWGATVVALRSGSREEGPFVYAFGATTPALFGLLLTILVALGPIQEFLRGGLLAGICLAGLAVAGRMIGESGFCRQPKLSGLRRNAVVPGYWNCKWCGSWCWLDSREDLVKWTRRHAPCIPPSVRDALEAGWASCREEDQA